MSSPVRPIACCNCSHDQVLPDKIFEILGRQTLRLQNLFHEFTQRHGLAVAAERTKHLIGRRHHRVVADMNAEILRFLKQHEPDIDFLLDGRFGEVRIFIGPFAVGTEPVGKHELGSGHRGCLRRA